MQEEEERIQRTYRNGRVVYTRWNPISRRFKLEQGTSKLINDPNFMNYILVVLLQLMRLMCYKEVYLRRMQTMTRIFVDMIMMHNS